MNGARALRRSAFGLVAAAALLAAPASPAGATPAAHPAGSTTTASTGSAAPDLSKSPILQNLAACIGEKKTGDLVVLVDTSGSLSGAGSSGTPTDPTDVRVAGAQALLGGLARSFDEVGAKVDLTVAGFDDDVTTVVDSTPLTEAALPALDGQLADFANRDRGAETDYWTALTWLNRTLQDKAAARPDGPGSCQFAIWFTDGSFTIWPRDGSSQADLDPLNSQTKDIPGFEETPLTDRATADAALAAAKEELCRPGGTADQLRATGVTLIGVGLGNADGDRFGFMRNIVENPDGSCGSQPGRGVFVPADSVGDLFLALAGLGEWGAGGITTNPVCQGQPCPEGTYQFKLDNTVSAVHFDAVVDDGSDQLIRTGLQVTITPPSGAPMVIDGNGADSGTSTSALATAQYEWLTGDPLAVDLDRVDGQDWTGDWKVTFVDTTGEHPDAVSNIALTLTSDFAIAPVVVDPGDWRVGEAATVRFEPQTLAGSPVALTTLPDNFKATAEVSLPGAGRPVQEIPVSLSDPVTVQLPADGDPGLAIVISRVDGQVAGQPLGTVSRQASVLVQPPFGVPVVDPANQVVDFGAVEGPVTASGTLTVVGPEEGDGCVTVSAGSVQGPRNVAAQIATPNGGGCFPAPSGQTVQVPLTLTPSAEGNGPLTGEIVVGLSSADNPGQVSEQRVGFRLDMTRLPNTGAKAGVLIGALLLGLLIPLLIIWLVRRLSARFPKPDQATLQSIVIPVQISGAGLSAAGGGNLAVPPDGWSAVPPPGPGRRTMIASGVAIRARAGWRFSEPGYAELDNAGDDVGVGEALPPSDGKGRPRFPLAVQGTWAVLAPRQLAISPIDAVQGRLLLVVETGADQAKRNDLISRAAGEAPTAFADARAKARKAAGAPENPPPGPSAPPPGSGPPQPPPWGGPTNGPTNGPTSTPPPWGGPNAPTPPSSPPWGGPTPAPTPGGWPPSQPGGSGPVPPATPPGWGSSGPGGGAAPSGPAGWPPSADPRGGQGWPG